MKTRNATLVIHRSKLDINGNSYHAIEWLECDRSRLAVISGDNAAGVPFVAYGRQWDPPSGRWINVVEVKHPIREFNRLVKRAPYAGCTPAEIWNWLEAALEDGKEVINVKKE